MRSRPPPGVLWRDDVVATVNAGLGTFLGRVDVERSMRGGQFVGWRILSLQPESFWRDVDLKPGDIVMSVNGMRLERPTQAHAAFVSLKTARHLQVELLREGRRRKLRLRIVERGGGSRRGRPSAAKPQAKPGGRSESQGKAKPSGSR